MIFAFVIVEWATESNTNDSWSYFLLHSFSSSWKFWNMLIIMIYLLADWVSRNFKNKKKKGTIFCRCRFRGQRLAITQGIANTVARGSLQCFCLVFLWLHISVLVSFLCVLHIQETAPSQLGRSTKRILPNSTNFLKKCDFGAVQRSALCRSRRELSNAYLLAKFGFDTAENEPSKVCRTTGLTSRSAAILVQDQKHSPPLCRCGGALSRCGQPDKWRHLRGAVPPAVGNTLSWRRDPN